MEVLKGLKKITDNEEAELISKKLRISQLVKILNRDFANNLGDIRRTDDKRIHSLIARQGGRRFSLWIGVENPEYKLPMLVGGKKMKLKDNSSISGMITQIQPERFFVISASGDIGDFDISGNSQGLKSFVSFKKGISKTSDPSEFRKTRRELNRKIRRGLKENGFRVTPQARLKQAWRIARNTGVAIGSSYGLATAAYKIAENFVQLPKIPIFP